MIAGRAPLSSLVIGVVLAWPAPAQAQITAADSTAFSVERFTPAPGHGNFFAVEDGDVLPRYAVAAGAWLSLSSRPLVLRELGDGSIASEPVRLRAGLDLTAAVGLGPRYQVGIAFPLLAQGGDRLQGIGLDEAGLGAVGAGDLRLHGKVRLVGQPGEPGAAVAIAALVTLPTGDDGNFAGEAGSVVEWRLLGSWRRPRGAIAVNLGARIRTEEVVFLSPARAHGNELTAAIAGELVVPGLRDDALALLGEYAVVRGDPTTGDNRGPSPQEVRAGARLRLASGWAITVGGGLGTSPAEIGSPAWRLLAGVIRDPAPVSDLDRDGIIDARDRCRADAEDLDGFEDRDGCPDPDDDGDGLPDVDDRCPRAAEDVDGYRDLDGCPDAETGAEPTPITP